MNKIQILKHSKAFDTLNRYLFRFTIQTRCEQSSQCQRSLVRLPSLSVLGYLNYTLASNQIITPSVDASQVSNNTPISVVEGTGNISTSSTTQFVSDAKVVSSTLNEHVKVDPSFLNSSTDNTSQDIKSFLAKPIILRSGVFSTTDTFSTFSTDLVPNQIISASPLMEDKLKGFFGFRATMVFRLVVNANRFQQGRYNLQFLPTGGAVTSVGTGLRLDAAESTLIQRSQLPHVELDLNCDTEAILKYPYVSCLNFLPLKSVSVGTAFGSVGYVRIYPYSPLVAPAGSTTCAYTLWASFEDIQLIGVATPQSGRAFSTSTRRKNETEAEQDSSSMGPISSALIKVSKASRIVSKIPLLSSYAIATSWYSDILASAANVFGWSKPVNLEHSGRISQNYLPYTSNVDGPDNSFPLSLSYKNQVGRAEGFSGTDIDEMDFSFLCTIPTFWRTWSWTTSQTAGTNLFNLVVSPFGPFQSRTVSSRVILDLAPYQFVSRFFSQWRGSFVYKLKFVKTEFHSGRLSIAFNQQETSLVAPAGTTLADSAYLHRHIIDIREANEFTFIVPYISSSPYKGTNDAIGVVSVLILDPLVAPDTVSAAISIIVEISMGPDAGFAVPINTIMSPVLGIAPQSGEPFTQALGIPNECSNYDGTLGSSTPVNDDGCNALFCVGERISSLRALLKMPCVVAPTGTVVAANCFNILPFSTPFMHYNGTLFSKNDYAPDLLALVSICYTFARGGVRLKYLDNSAVTSADPFVVFINSKPPDSLLTQSGFHYDAEDGSNTPTTALNRIGLPCTFYRAGYSGEVQVPQYGKFHTRAISDTICNTPSSIDYNVTATSTAPKYYVTRTNVPSSATLASVLRSASDDFNLGGFLSIPPMSDN